MMFASTKRFVIISSGRTGSNFLERTLRTHPWINSKGEIIFRERNEWPKSSAIEHIEKRYYEDMGRCTGFRFLYAHFTAAKDFLAYVKEKKIFVIHLKRNNILDVVISNRLGWANHAAAGGYKAWLNTPYEKDRIPIAYGVCLKEMRKYNNHRECVDRELENHEKKMDVFYEDLVADMDKEFRRIFTFLDVPYAKLTAMTKKQRQKSQAESVANYGNLKASFEGTQYAQYFMD